MVFPNKIEAFCRYSEKDFKSTVTALSCVQSVGLTARYLGVKGSVTLAFIHSIEHNAVCSMLSVERVGVHKKKEMFQSCVAIWLNASVEVAKCPKQS